MNIKEAKEQIKNAITAYFTKDEYGNYIVPIEKQRPIFLMGAPGIGKTAIIEQIAAEMGVGVLSYSMTHHTRQSALGLPFIVHKNYGGFEYDVSEYTMSEIISSIYDLMENTGAKEGILFLDEINCVSETLSPIMLQFLQYKVFGRHRVPDGWIVVTAGNPPEYNNSVREFDIVTWDRLKRIDVEPDFDTWKEYAYKAGVHPAVLTYLEIKKSNFYKIESTVDGKRFITARGWDDLSQMIKLYEQNNLIVDKKLICQYIQDKKICADFAGYYDLFKKYRSDYQVNTILAGEASDIIKERATHAAFDERLALLGLIVSSVTEELSNFMRQESLIQTLMQELKRYKTVICGKKVSPETELTNLIDAKNSELKKGKTAGNLSKDDQRMLAKLIGVLESFSPEIKDTTDSEKALEYIKQKFDNLVKEHKKNSVIAKKHLENAFIFLDEVFPDGQEILVFVTELTANYYTAKFIARYGCDEYYKHNKELLFYERRQEILAELDEL